MKLAQKIQLVQRQRKILFPLFLILSCLLFGKTPALGQLFSIPVGDSIRILQATQPFSPPNCVPCEVYGVDYTNFNRSNFFLDIPKSQNGFPSQDGGYVVFTPMRIGIQYDTFNITVRWGNHASDYYVKSDPVFVSARGTSDSIIRFRFLASYNVVEYDWNIDSSVYFAYNNPPSYTGFSKQIELVNNVEDSTTFDFKISIDPSAQIHAMIAIDGDSVAFPHILIIKPLIRRKRGFIYFYTDSKGFDTTTTFIATVQVVMHNSSSQDTSNVGYVFRFEPKPASSVHSLPIQNENDFQILSVLGNHNITISSNFPQPENTTIELFDALGRPQPLPNSELFIPSGAHTEKLEVGNLPSGWYMLRMKTKDQVINKSFMLLH